ncbi:ABC transporter permease [Sporosarcina sp. ITBMC105]
MWLRMVQFEVSKIFKTKYFRTFSFILLLFLIAYYVFVYINTTRLDEVVSNLEGTLTSMEKQLAETEEGTTEYEIFNNVYEKHRHEVEAYKKHDWPAVMNHQIELLPPDLDSNIVSRQYYTSSFPTLFTMETRRAQYNWLIEKEIEPVFWLWDVSWKTAYDLYYPMAGVGDDEFLRQIVEKYSNQYSSTGIYYAKHVAGLLFSLGGVVFFSLLFGDVVTKEGLAKNGSIHLLRTQPINRHGILVGKFIAILLVSFVFLVGIGAISVVLGAIFDRLGDWDYPVLVYGEDYAFEFINMGTFILKSALLFFMVLLFCYSLLFLYSILAKRMILALGLTILTILIGVQLAEQSILSSFAHYIPFHYFSTTDIVTMEFAATLKNFNFTYTTGMMVLAICSGVLLVATYMLSLFQYKSQR